LRGRQRTQAAAGKAVAAGRWRTRPEHVQSLRTGPPRGPRAGSRSLDQVAGPLPSFRSRIAHPGLKSLYDYWLARSGADEAMPRAALDPADITPLLKNLILAEVGDGGEDIRYRLGGTEIVAAHGFDYTGWTVERLTQGATLAFTRRLYGVV